MNNNKRISFGSITPVLDMPDLLAIQTETFESFIQLKRNNSIKYFIHKIRKVFSASSVAELIVTVEL